MNSCLLKIGITCVVWFTLALILLSADRNAVAFSLRQVITPDQTSITPTIVATRVPNSIPNATISATPNPTAPTDDSVYVVKPGDTLWLIATKVYGNGSQYVLIQRANNLPNNAVLKVGSMLIIPSPVQPTLIAPTSTPTPTIALTETRLPMNTNNSSVPVSGIASPTSLAIAVISPSPTNLNMKTSDYSWTPLVPYIQLTLNILSALCLLGSFSCIALALESYQHSRPYIRRRTIGSRVRNGL